MVFGLMLKGDVMQRRLGKRMLTLLLVILAVTTACEKKRKSRYVQGDGEYVYALNDFKGATYTLKTGKKRTPGVTTRADELVVTEGSSVMRSFNSVEFELKTDVGDFSSATMNNFDFYGEENKEYKVQLDFTEQKLVFFQIAKKAEIPSNVVTYAEDLGNDQYRVPLFGLPLSKVTVERIKDDRGKSTNQIRTFPKNFLSEATHFLVNVNTPAHFDSELKLDMLPSKFFDEKNEWFYEVSVVDKPIALDSSGLELGIQLGNGKFRFAKTNNSVLAVDLNIADEAVGQDSEKLNVIFEIPVQWMDYRLVKSGDQAYLKEEAFKSIEEGAKFWKDREYALLQLDRVLSIDAASTNNIKIKRLEVGDDYFSFIIYDSLSKYSLHYSFAKKNEVAEGKVYPREDFRRFGFFESFKELYSGNLNSSEDTISRSKVQNRMIPPNRTITFHITDNTPTDPIFLDAIKESIVGWNWAFAEAAKGTEYENDPIKVELDIVKPVQNGDARYHKVSFYGYEVESGLLGYGPSVTDNRNGEIFSSTNHIYLRNYRESIIRNLVNYIRYRLGAYSGLAVDGITVPNQILTVESNPGYDFGSSGGMAAAIGGVDLFKAPLDLSASIGGSKVYQSATDTNLNLDIKSIVSNYNSASTVKKLASVTRAKQAKRYVRTTSSSILQSFMQARKRLESGFVGQKEFEQELMSARAADPKAGETCEMLAATSLTFKEIEDVCGSANTEFADYVAELQGRVAAGDNIYRLDSEREVLLNCAQKLMKPTLIATLAHEFGHNFGLRHNFQGSADYKNFARSADGVPESRMASVMDYSHADADRGTRPAPYDIAAIRYGYYDSVLVEDKATGNQKVVSVKAKDKNDLRPIEQRVLDSQGPGVKVRDFAFCSDEHIDGYPSAQIGIETPFCERWDQGADPVTKVRSGIDSAVTSMLTSGNRFDMERLASPAGLAANAISRSVGGIRNVYDKYRFMLYTQSKSISAQSGQLQDDPYFDTTTEAATELLVIGKTELDKANALVAELRANPVVKTEVLEKKVLALSEIAQYKVASEITKDFFLEVAFSQSNYCVALRATGNGYEYLDAEPVATVRSKNFLLTGTDSTRCEDTTAYFAKKIATTLNTTVTVDKVISIGNPYDNVSFTANPEVLALRSAVRTGNGPLRMVALAFMAPRSSLAGAIFYAFTGDPDVTAAIQSGLWTAANDNFMPSLFDGQAFRDKYMAKLQARLTEGVQIAELVKFTDSKIQGTEGKSVAAPQGLRERKLPFYQEEKDFLGLAWESYKLGVQSPRAVTSSKTASTTIQALPIDNFIGFGGPARYQEYLVSSDGYAYFTNGTAAVALITAFNKTDNDLKAIAQKKTWDSDPAKRQIKLEAFDQKVSTLLKGYLLAPTKLSDHYQSLNDVMYQVRVCVLNSLVKEYGLDKSRYPTLNNESEPTAIFNVAKYCDAPRTGDALQLTVYEEEFLVKARALINYVKPDTKFTNANTLDAILNKIGLPRGPDARANPEETLTAIFKSKDVIGEALAGYEYGYTTLSALENAVAQNAFARYNAALDDPTLAAAPSIEKFVAEARLEETEKLKADEPYVTHLNDKLEILRNLIFSP